MKTAVTRINVCSQDDIEKVVAEIEREEARRQRVKEAVVEAPSRRVNFSLTAHPFKDELILFGGEFHDGRQVYINILNINGCFNAVIPFF